MIKNNTYMGHALGIVVGITMLGLLLVHGAGNMKIKLERLLSNKFGVILM
jgi:hypothetical protein